MLISLSVAPVIGQIKYGVSGSVAFATGRLANDYNGGLGFDIMARQEFGEQLDLGVGAGLYTMYSYNWDKKILPFYASIDVYLYQMELGPVQLKAFAGGNGGLFLSWFKSGFVETSGNFGLTLAPRTGLLFDFESFEVFAALQYNGSLPRENAFLGFHVGTLF